MFAKCSSVLLTSLVLSAPLALPAPAQAQIVVTAPVYRHHLHRYFVEFRPFLNTPWQVSGPYRSQAYAHDVARDLRVRGFQVRVVRQG